MCQSARHVRLCVDFRIADPLGTEAHRTVEREVDWSPRGAHRLVARSCLWTRSRGVYTEFLDDIFRSVSTTSLSDWPHQTDRLVEVGNVYVARSVDRQRERVIQGRIRGRPAVPGVAWRFRSLQRW